MSFDPSKSYEVVEEKPVSTFDPSQPFETISGDGEVARYKAPEEQPATDWDALFSGLDQAEFGMTIFQRQAWGRLKTDTDNSKSTQAQAINQAYVSAHIPQYSPEYVTNNWDAGVKESFAKNVLGIDHSGITDEEFYAAVKDHEYFKKIYRRIEFENEDPIGKINLLFQMASAKTYQNVNKMWDKANTPFFPLPSAPQMPDIRGLGPNNPAILAATWNSIKPLIEGLETPLGVGTMGTVPVLAALSRVSKAAKAALFGVEGLFTALMAKGTIEAAKAAPEVFEDPNSTLQQRIEAVGVPVASGLATVAGAVGAVYTLKTPAGRAELTFNMQGKTPEEIAILYRQEAAASTKPKEIEALNQAADAFGQLSESALKPKEEGAVAEVAKKTDEPEVMAKEEAQPKTPVIEELENGGFVVTQDGKLIDYAKTLDEANELAGKVQAEAVKPVSQPEATKAAEVVSEPVKSPEAKTVGVRNADVFEQAKKMGLPEPTKGEGLKFTEAVDRANKAFEADPDAGRKLITSLKENPRPITGEQNAILARELTRLVKERELAETAFIEATNMGDPIAIADAKAQVNKSISDFGEAADLDAQVGTQNALGLALRQLRLKEDYSLASMERRMQVANEGKPLTEVQSQRVRDLHSRLQAAEKQLDEYRAGKTQKKTTKTITERLSEQADAARERIKARLAEGRQQSGLDPLDLADHAIIGADYLAKGVVKAAEWTDSMVKEFGERIRPHLQAIRERADSINDGATDAILEQKRARLEKRIAEIQEKIDTGNLSPLPTKKNRPAVPVIEKLELQKADLMEELNRLRKDDAKIKELEEAIAEKTRKIEEGDLTPKGIPVNRPNLNETIEVLKQQRDALNVDLEKLRNPKLTPEQRLLNQIEAQIANIEEQIISGEIFPKGKKPSTVNSPEIEAAQKRLDELIYERENLRDTVQAKDLPEPKAPKTAEEKTISALDNQIEKLEEQLKNETPFSAGKKKQISTPEIQAKRAKIEELKAERANMRERLQPSEAPRTKEEIRLDNFKGRKSSAIEELQRRIDEGDFTPKEKPEPLHLDAEANRLQAEQDILRLEYDRLLEKNRYENLTPLQKAGENIVTAWDSTRAVLAGFEFSSVGRQGATRLFSSPKKTISAMADAFRAFASNEAGAHAINLKVLNSPDAALARQNKLALIDEKISLSKQEENYMGKLVGKIPGVRNFEQFARVFLNKVRLDMWSEMRKDFPDASPKLLADFVNSATGRGSLGKLEAAAVPLNRVLFSPRFLASRIQMSTGYYVWKAAINGDKAAVKAVSREYAKAMAGYGVFLSALYFGAQAYTDEEVSIGTNPTSSDFLKLKVGNTRIDVGAGNLQPLVFLSQMAAGERTTARGDSVPIRGEGIPFGGEDAYDRATNFARSKFNPSLSKSVDFLTGTNIVGEPATLTDLLYPATYGDIIEAFQEQGVPEATAISLLALFGAGVQTYDPNKPRAGKNTPSPFRDGQ